MTTQKVAPGFTAVRRFVNLSRMEQRVQNPKQGSYESVKPKEYVEGAEYVHCISNPFLRETTAHLTEEEVFRRAQVETDVDLLKRLAMIETNEIQPRHSVVKVLQARIKKLEKDDAAADNANGDSAGQGKTGAAITAGAAGASS